MDLADLLLGHLATAPAELLHATLMDAAARGCPQLIKGLLQRMDVACEDVTKFETVFLAAACSGSASCLAAMLELPSWRGRLLAAADSEGRTALILAAARGHAPCVTVLLKHDPESQVMASSGQHRSLSELVHVADCGTALMHASAGGHEQCVQRLLEHAPCRQVAAADGQGVTALMRSAYGRHAGCVRLLLAHDPLQQVRARTTRAAAFGLNANECDYKFNRGTNALMLASAGSPECVALLLRHAPNEQVAVVDKHCWNALAVAAENNPRPAACFRLLLAHSPEAQVAAARYSYCSALMLVAARVGPDEDSNYHPLPASEGFDCMQLLLAHGYPQSMLNGALAWAAEAWDRAGEPEHMSKIIWLLLSKGAALLSLTEAEAGTVQAVVQELAAHRLMPGAVDSVVQAAVGLAHLVRGSGGQQQQQQRGARKRPAGRE